MKYLLGIDIGTSGTKSVLFDTEGNTVASNTAEYPLYQPHNGWAEQDPLDWWKGVCDSVRAVTASVDKSEIAGVGLSGQMHGLVMLDARGNVIRRSIIWCDQRTAAECDEITRKIGREKLIDITANPALTGFTTSKLLWVRNNEPENYAKCRKVLLPKDYIRYMLTGEYATEVSDASGMQLMDIKGRCWSDEVLQKLDIDKSLLGEMHESYEVSGRVTARAAQETGLAAGTPVVGGAGDQAAGAVGNGIVKSGIISSTIGTSGVVFAHTDSPVIDKLGRVHTFCHAVPGAWHIMGVTQGAGLSLKWFRDNFCGAEMETAALLGYDPYVIMDQQADTVPAGSNGIVYLPYLMGERTPHLDPDARGVFFGLSAIHTKKDLLRAVMEGVTFSLRDCLEIIRATGITVDEVRASGGGGKSRLWRQMQADVFGCAVKTVNSAEGPALGVALLAGVGTGVYKSVPEACEAVIKTTKTQKCDEAASKAYQGYYKLYTALYPALRSAYAQLGAL